MGRPKKIVASDAPQTRQNDSGATETAIVAQVAPKQELSVEAIIQSAITNNVPVETMERLLAMRRELKQEAAKEAYDTAMAAFQSECPTIVKTKEVFTKNGQLAYKYAPIESIVQQVAPYLKKHGFSYSTTMELKENGVRVVCKITHEAGHSEESPMEVPFGTQTQIMSNSQVAAAASTFAKRYAFCNAFGILTGDEDTDARPLEEKREPMKSYRVERKQEYPEMDETNDAHAIEEPSKEGLQAQRMEIAKLLQKNHNFTVLGKTGDEVKEKVAELTGIKLVEENYADVIDALRESIVN